MKSSNIYIQLFKEAVWVSFWARIYSIASVLAVAASIMGITLKDYKESSLIRYVLLFFKKNFSIVACIILTIFCIRLIIVSARLLKEKHLSNDTAYTPVKLVKQLKNICTSLNSLIIGDNTRASTLAEICNRLREIFDKLTDSRCCVSIKLIESDTDIIEEMTISQIMNLSVKSIARDNNHYSRDTRTYQNTVHYIRDNTAYSTIVSKLTKKVAFYLNNDVNIENSYCTSSPYTDENGESINPPYKSELVFPIMKDKSNNKYTFIGFLCIDSEKENSFKKYDVGFEIASMYAENLYWIINNYQ